MPEKSNELANLARIGKLSVEPGTRGEIAGLLASGSERLADGRKRRQAALVGAAGAARVHG